MFFYYFLLEKAWHTLRLQYGKNLRNSLSFSELRFGAGPSPVTRWYSVSYNVFYFIDLFLDMGRTRPPPQGTGYTHNTHLQKEFEDANPAAPDILNPGNLESAELALAPVIEVTSGGYKVTLVHSGEGVCLYSLH